MAHRGGEAAARGDRDAGEGSAEPHRVRERVRGGAVGPGRHRSAGVACVGGSGHARPGVLPHWIDLLERGDDATFIDEAVVPEELAKVLDGKSKDELVTTFREDKHMGVLKMLRAIRAAAPTKVRQEQDRTIVTYDLNGEKGVTFVVVGASVYIKN